MLTLRQPLPHKPLKIQAILLAGCVGLSIFAMAHLPEVIKYQSKNSKLMQNTQCQCGHCSCGVYCGCHH